MTTPPIEELRACARGCTYPNHDDAGLTTDEPSPDPRPATHGLLCGRCYYRLTTALDTIPELVHNMRSQITKTGAAQYGERVTGGGDGSPAPLAIDPLDASDSLYAKLVSWSEVFAHEFGIPQPRMSVWANFREVQGFRPVTPDTARNIMQQMTRWYLAIAEQIAASAQAVEFHDDLCYGWDDARGVFPLLGRYGIEPRPPRPPAAHECPVCGADDIFVKWPDKLNPDLEVLCARCHHLVDADLVNRHARRMGVAETLHVVVTVTSAEILDVLAWAAGDSHHHYDERTVRFLTAYQATPSRTRRAEIFGFMPAGLQWALNEHEQGRDDILHDTLNAITAQAAARALADKAADAARKATA